MISLTFTRKSTNVGLFYANIIEISFFSDIISYNFHSCSNNLQSTDIHPLIPKHNVSAASAEYSQCVRSCGQSGHHHVNEQNVREPRLPTYFLG